MMKEDFYKKIKYKCSCGEYPDLLEVTVSKDFFDISNNGEYKYQCRCYECNIETRLCKTPDGAVKAWNRMPSRGYLNFKKIGE